MSYVIACGDEGVQINEGTRLAVLGAGFRLDGFAEIISTLKTLFGKKLAIVSNDENAWIKETLALNEWDQVNAMMQQHIEALADREKLLYAGHVPFSDPQALAHGIKGHMVRPHNIHIANKICFTLGGGEQKFNLGCFVISADWVSEVPFEVAEKLIMQQVEFYKKLAKKDVKFLFEEGGELGEAVAQKNRAVLESMGINASV
jgi:hypothetical protein